jgi:hypothetical protein
MTCGAARHGQAKAHIDEQPAGCLPSGLGEAASAFSALPPAACCGALPKLADTSSDKGFNKSGVLVHAVLLSTRILVTRIVVTRSLVKAGERPLAAHGK